MATEDAVKSRINDTLVSRSSLSHVDKETQGGREVDGELDRASKGWEKGHFREKRQHVQRRKISMW